MTGNALTPLLGNNTTKTTIVKVLTENELLSLKQLHLEIQKLTQKQITYQATHKAIKEMVADGVIEKTSDKKYKIHVEWVNNIEGIMQDIKNNQLTKHLEESKVYTYDTFGKFVSAIIRLVHDAPNPENKPGTCITHHAWPTIGLSETDYKLLSELLKETKYHDVSSCDTPLDSAFAKTLEKMGKTVKVGSELEITLDTICKGDHLFEVSFAKELEDTMERIFNTHKTIDENTIDDILKNVMAKKTLIRIIHTISKEQAKKFREKVLLEFNINKVK